jgi:factor associated with neutral sphingomyelinase activation
MGSTPEGEPIDDVILPRWAKNAEDYLMKSRVAFESDFVSSHLHDWIDLIFGYKQSGTQAIISDNVFYYLTYQENVNLERVMSRMERAALEVQISEFGQIPVRLFSECHSSRKVRILHLEMVGDGSDNKVYSGKLLTLTEENERLQEKLEREKYRYNRKLNEKEEIIQEKNREKKKDIDKLK